MPSRKLVLTSLHQRDYSTAEAFLRSLRATGHAGDIVILTSRVPAPTLTRLHAEGVRTLPFLNPTIRLRNPLAALWPVWRLVFRMLNSPRASHALGKLTFNTMSSRFIYFLEYLAAHATDYDAVLISDIRDVWFQANPFEVPLPPGVHSFLEGAPRLIRDCPMNSLWIRKSFGTGGLQRAGGWPVCCAGLTLGDTASMLKYLEAMHTWQTRSRWMGLVAGTDQGVHNWILHQGLVPQTHLHANFTGPALTMGLLQPAQIHCDASGRILNPDGRPVPMLHQYDRHPELAAHLTKNVGHL